MADFTPHEAAAHEAQALPVILPAKLVGRDAVLAKVYSHLKQNQAVVISGPAGIGKTALAATLASAYTQQPGGALWLEVDNSSLVELIVRIGRAYDELTIANSDNPLGMIGATANVLTQHKPLIVLDGKHDAKATQEFIQRCASELPALIVSQEKLPDDGWETVELGRLDADSSVGLFKLLAGLNGQPAVEADVEKLMGVLSYAPFAIAVAATAIRANKQTPSDYLAAIPAMPPDAEVNPQLLALTTSFRSLNSALQGVLLMMGATFKGQASGELLSMISGAPQDTLNQVMPLLAQRYLVERIQRYGNPYYRLHAITHTFAQGWLRGSGRLEGLQSKVRDTVLTYARKYSADDEESYLKLATEIDTFLALAQWAANQGDREPANQLVAALTQAGDFVQQFGYVYELLRLRQLAASSTAAFAGHPVPLPAQPQASPAPARAAAESEELEDEDFLEEEEEFGEISDEFEPFEDEEEEAEVEAPIAAASAESGDMSRLRAQLAQARQERDRKRQIELLKQIGKLQVEANMENEAISTYTEALMACEAEGNNEGVLEMLDMLSALMTKTENSQAAVLHTTRGLKIAEELGDQDTRMHLLTTLGDARQQLGENAEAVRNYSQALELARKAEDSTNEALILYKLGYAQLDNGEPETAIQTWEQALELFRKQNRRDYEGRVLGGLGLAHTELEHWSEAIRFHTSSLYIAREVHDLEEEALQLSNLGYAAVQAKQLSEAVLRYRQALHLAYKTDDVDNIVSTIVDLVRLLVESPRHLGIAELLIQDALRLEPHDRDVNKLQERIASEKTRAAANGVEQKSVNGTARDYATNAYALLEG